MHLLILCRCVEILIFHVPSEWSTVRYRIFIRMRSCVIFNPPTQTVMLKFSSENLSRLQARSSWSAVQPAIIIRRWCDTYYWKRYTFSIFIWRSFFPLTFRKIEVTLEATKKKCWTRSRKIIPACWIFRKLRVNSDSFPPFVSEREKRSYRLFFWSPEILIVVILCQSFCQSLLLCLHVDDLTRQKRNLAKSKPTQTTKAETRKANRSKPQ